MLALALAGNDALKPNGALKLVEPPGVPGGRAGLANAGGVTAVAMTRGI
jgi:hypothetical protein